MNEILNFFQEIVTSNLTNQKPIGLSGFKNVKNIKPAPKKHYKKEEISLSELLRKH